MPDEEQRRQQSKRRGVCQPKDQPARQRCGDREQKQREPVMCGRIDSEDCKAKGKERNRQRSIVRALDAGGVPRSMKGGGYFAVRVWMNEVIVVVVEAVRQS